MKKLILILVFITWMVPVHSLEKETIFLKKCVDGDTAVFEINGEEKKVRFLAIDTPETVHPTKEIEAYGKNASEYTCNRLTNAKSIEIEYDEGSNKVDKYGRTLGWIYIDNSLIQEELIKIGYARVKYIYGKYKYTEKLYELEQQAKNEKIGIWAEEIPETYIVTFKNENEIIKVKVNENEKVEELNIKKEGYTFEGWYQNNKIFNFDTKINKDITLEAKFTKNYTTSDIIIFLLILLILYMINPKKTKRKIKNKLKKLI